MRKTTPLAVRFWPKVDRWDPDHCWLWTANTNERGYGRMSSGGAGGTTLYAHRVAYELLVGPIPEGLQIDHLCRVRACVNPKHLEPVTHAENMRRGAPAMQTHCKRGHEYTPENTGLHLPKSEGQRFCRTCRAAAVARYKAEGRSVQWSRRYKAKKKAARAA